ncbi:MAG: alpha-glucosidase [bacterium]
MSQDHPQIVLIGAGSAQFGYGTLGDIFQSEDLKQRKAHIVLHDINETTLTKVAKKGQEFINSYDLPFTISATTSRKQALEGADFCIISIEVGNRFELWEQDWRIPQQYGMRQVYGENGGPGGFFHSLRIIPPILEICGDITDICPDAFVFNFSNPMSRICTTVHRKYPKLKFIGLCHEISSLKKHLPKLLETPLENIFFRAAGLNHFSVLLAVQRKDRGEDAYPEVLEKAPAYFETYIAPFVENNLPRRRSAGFVSPWYERGVFRTILEKYHLLPITTDSHFGEYLSWAYDIADHKGILDFYDAYKKYVMQSEPKIELKLTERAIPIIEGILNDAGFEETAVNIPNAGLIPDLPEFIAVEAPAVVNKVGIHGIPIGNLLPKGFTGLLYNQVAIHSMTAETVLTGSRDIALQALLVDPIVDKVSAAEKMLDHILEVQKSYLGYIK